MNATPFDKVPAFLQPVVTGRGLDALKVFAIFLMVIDHVNYIVYDTAYYWAFLLGRGAWPLFAFAAGVALLRADDAGRWRQARILLLCALIAEPVAQLTRTDVPANILFTLSLACVLAVASWRLPGSLRITVFILSPLLMVWPSLWEFGICGALLPVAIMHALAGQGRYWWGIALWLSLFMNFGGWLTTEAPLTLVVQTAIACVTLPLAAIWLLREMLGTASAQAGRFLPRYALHAFYPLHLLALWLLRFL